MACHFMVLQLNILAFVGVKHLAISNMVFKSTASLACEFEVLQVLVSEKWPLQIIHLIILK